MRHTLQVPLSTGRVNDFICNPLLGRSTSEKVVSEKTKPSFTQDLFENKNGILQIPFLVGSASIFCRQHNLTCTALDLANKKFGMDHATCS